MRFSASDLASEVNQIQILSVTGDNQIYGISAFCKGFGAA